MPWVAPGRPPLTADQLARLDSRQLLRVNEKNVITPIGNLVPNTQAVVTLARNGPRERIITAQNISKSGGFRGVTRQPTKKGNAPFRWKAALWTGGSNQYIGTYTTAVQAARAYDRFRVQQMGESHGRPGCNFNFDPDDPEDDEEEQEEAAAEAREAAQKAKALKVQAAKLAGGGGGGAPAMGAAMAGSGLRGAGAAGVGTAGMAAAAAAIAAAVGGGAGGVDGGAFGAMSANHMEQLIMAQQLAMTSAMPATSTPQSQPMHALPPAPPPPPRVVYPPSLSNAEVDDNLRDNALMVVELMQLQDSARGEGGAKGARADEYRTKIAELQVSYRALPSFLASYISRVLPCSPSSPMRLSPIFFSSSFSLSLSLSLSLSRSLSGQA